MGALFSCPVSVLDPDLCHPAWQLTTSGWERLRPSCIVPLTQQDWPFMQHKLEAKVTHRFAAPPESVFGAFVEPEQVRRWQEAWLSQRCDNGKITAFSYDPQVQGRFAIETLEDGRTLQNWGTFLALDRPTRIRHTHITDIAEKNDPAVVTIIIEPEPEGPGSIVTLYDDLDQSQAGALPQTERGWRHMLEAIDAILAQKT
jgi:uncharacterized protein YndB with AHSA1/START domain